MDSSCKGDDKTVFGGGEGTGIVEDIEIDVSGFSVDKSLVSVNEDIHVG